MTRTAIVLATALSIWAGDALAADYTVGTIQVGNPWTRATPKGSTVAGGYMTISNKGTAPDRLVGGSAAVAGRFEVHSMAMDQGVAKMRPVEGGLEIKPGETRRAQARIVPRHAHGTEAAAREGPEGQGHAGIREGRQGRHRIHGRGDRRDVARGGRASALTRQQPRARQPRSRGSPADRLRQPQAQGRGTGSRERSAISCIATKGTMPR